MTWPKNTYLPTYHLCISIREHPKGAIIGICDIWDTDYITHNWEPGLMTIFVTWQLIGFEKKIFFKAQDGNKNDVLFIVEANQNLN